jgi:hypothetical protein
MVTITDAGRERLAHVLPGQIAVLREMFLEPLSRADVDALAALLTPVRDHVRASPSRARPPSPPRKHHLGYLTEPLNGCSRGL